MYPVYLLIETCESESPIVFAYTHKRTAYLAGIERILEEQDMNYITPTLTDDEYEELCNNGSLANVLNTFEDMLNDSWTFLSDEWLAVESTWVVTTEV